VIGITTNGSRDAFDQTFIDTLGVAIYDGSMSLTKVAHAIGGNHRTMSQEEAIPYKATQCSQRRRRCNRT
jgi:hypothetical protein